MSREQLEQIGAMLASCVDMAKGFMGPQFSVSIICRHQSGPFHMLLGDDSELALIQTLSELQRVGKALIATDGGPLGQNDDPEPTVWDHMVNMLRECAEQFADYARLHQAKLSDPMLTLKAQLEIEQKVARNQELSDRAFAVLDMATSRSEPTPQPEDGQLTDPPQPVPIGPPSGGVEGGPVWPTLEHRQANPLPFDMADAPAVDGLPERCPICMNANPCDRHSGPQQRAHLQGLGE